MKRSITLALYLLLAARGGGDADIRRPPRPSGPLIWLHAGAGATLQSLGQLAERLVQEPGPLGILITADGPDLPDLGAMPPGTVADFLPPEKLKNISAFLNHWRPNLALIAGTSLPPVLIAETHNRGIPMILADVKLTRQAAARWRWQRGMVASLLARFTHILAQDPDSLVQLRKLGGKGLGVTVTGRIEETTDPLPCNEAERNTLAQLLQARPVWLAVNCPQAEQGAVIAAHSDAMRQAHRMLLIFVPDKPSDAEALNERMTREGWIVGQRSRDEEPDPDVQLYIADAEGELGLWYRLAPVTYMGGTLLQHGAGRSPFEPAALGSAIVYGPHTAPYPDAYARLSAASAARLVKTPAELAEAVSDLIAPDKAAILAHNAWSVSSGGAEVAERVVGMIATILALRSDRKEVV